MEGAPPRTVPIVAQKGRTVNALLRPVCEWVYFNFLGDFVTPFGW
jgi:hypothetical protein